MASTRSWVSLRMPTSTGRRYRIGPPPDRPSPAGPSPGGPLPCARADAGTISKPRGPGGAAANRNIDRRKAAVGRAACVTRHSSGRVADGRRGAGGRGGRGFVEPLVGGVERGDRDVDDPQVAGGPVAAAGLDVDDGHGADGDEFAVEL